jgi:hypothetical protein
MMTVLNRKREGGSGMGVSGCGMELELPKTVYESSRHAYWNGSNVGQKGKEIYGYLWVAKGISNVGSYLNGTLTKDTRDAHAQTRIRAQIFV